MIIKEKNIQNCFWRGIRIKMENKNNFLEIFKNFDKHIKYLQKKNINDLEQLRDSEDLYLAVSMSVFTLINNLIELGDEIIREEELEFPRKYREIATILFENSIIGKKNEEIFIKLIKIRNNIAHEYDVNIKFEDIFFVIENLNFFKEIISIAKKYCV